MRLCILTVAVSLTSVGVAASAVAATVELPLENGLVARISAVPGAVDTTRWPVLTISGEARIEAYGDCEFIEPQPDRPLSVNFKTKADWQRTISGLRFLTGFTTWKGVRSCGETEPGATAQAPRGPDFVFLWEADEPRYRHLPVKVHLAQAHVAASIEAKVKAGIAITNVIVGKELLRFDSARLLTPEQLEGRRPVILVQQYPQIAILSGPTVQQPNPAAAAIAGAKAVDTQSIRDTRSDSVQATTEWISGARAQQRAGANCFAGVFSVDGIVGNAQVKMAGGMRDEQESSCLFRGLLYAVGIDAKKLSVAPRLLEIEMNRGSAVLPNNAIKILDPAVVAQIRAALQ